MRIVFFTSAGFQSDEVFVYVFSRVAQHFRDVHVVAVAAEQASIRAWSSLLARYWRKLRRLGLINVLEIVSSYPLQRLLASHDRHAAGRLVQALPRRVVALDGNRVAYVTSVNGADAI